MTEVFNPLKLYCDVGQTEATIFVEANTDLRDNIDGYVTKPCKGCKKWSAEKIKRVEDEVKEEWGGSIWNQRWSSKSA